MPLDLKKIIFWLVGFSWLGSTQLFSGVPTPWWIQRGIVQTNLKTDDFAVANVGQAKQFAIKTVDEFQLRLPGGSGNALLNLKDSLLTENSQKDFNNFNIINIGQLKNLAQPFYDRLKILGYPYTAPWTTNDMVDDDYAGVNVGQLKNLFYFHLTSLPDADKDGMPDIWETQYKLKVNVPDMMQDDDKDKLLNIEEYYLNTNPNYWDTDQDLISDYNEYLYGMNPNVKDDLTEDIDQDGLTTFEEMVYGTDPGSPDTDGDGVNDGTEAHQGSFPNDPSDGGQNPGPPINPSCNE